MLAYFNPYMLAWAILLFYSRLGASPSFGLPRTDEREKNQLVIEGLALWRAASWCTSSGLVTVVSPDLKDLGHNIAVAKNWLAER